MAFFEIASHSWTASFPAADIGEFLTENNFGDTRSGSLAGPTGLVIILLLAIGTVLLIRNMNGRLKRLPESFDPPAADPTADPAADPPADSTTGRGPRETEQT